MKILLLVSILTLAGPLQAQAPKQGGIELQILKAEDTPEGGGCIFYLAPPNGTGSESETVLIVPSAEYEFITIRLNGVALKLKDDINHKWSGLRPSYRAAWTNGEVKLEVKCSSVSDSEGAEFLEGTLLVTKGRQHRQYKIRGFCGC